MLINNVELKNKTILVTGAAGFIGSNLVMELLRTVEPVNIVSLMILVIQKMKLQNVSI